MGDAVTSSKLLVTLAGAAAIVWVLWYFLATPAASGSERSKPKT